MSHLFTQKANSTMLWMIVFGWFVYCGTADVLAQVTVQTYTVSVPNLQGDEQEASEENDADTPKDPLEETAKPTKVQTEDAVDEEEPATDDEDDDDDAPAANNMLNNWGTTLAKVQGAKKFLLQQDFNVAVDEAIEVCELDERQLKRLKIASRGAVKKAYEKWKTTGLQQMGINNFGNQDAEENQDKEELEPEVYTDADDIDMQTMQLAGSMMNPFQGDVSTDSKFWKKALKAALGEEQHQKLMSHRSQRDQLRREKNVAAAVAVLTFELRLSDEKTAELSDLITPEMLKAKKLNIPMYEQYVLYYYASKASNSKLKKILSKAQLQKWKSVMGPAKQIGQMFEMQNAQGNARDGGAWAEAEELLSVAEDIVEGAVDFVEGIFTP